MKTIKYLLFVAGVSTFLIACSKTSSTDTTNSGGNVPPPPAGCDTANMKFAANVQPILQANCYSCHGNGNVNGGVTLDTYAGVKAVADNGKLVGVITHAAGFPPMPQGGTKLSDCNINKIKAWIARGAPEN